MVFKRVIKVCTRKPDYVMKLDLPIKLERVKEYELALTSLIVYNSIPNISDTKNNNKFVYSIDSGKNWTTFLFERGAYEFNEIVQQISNFMELNNHSGFLSLYANLPTLSAEIEIFKEEFVIDFSIGNICDILGFEKKKLSGVGKHLAKTIVNIEPVNGIVVNCDIVYGTIVNGKQCSEVYSLTTAVVPPGWKIIQEPSRPVFVPVNSYEFSKIHFQITDWDKNIIDFSNELIEMQFLLQECK